MLFAVAEVDPDCVELIEFISFYQCFATVKRDVAMLLAGLPGASNPGYLTVTFTVTVLVDAAL